jgi:hypothetical protein
MESNLLPLAFLLLRFRWCMAVMVPVILDLVQASLLGSPEWAHIRWLVLEECPVQVDAFAVVVAAVLVLAVLVPTAALWCEAVPGRW